MKDLEDDAFYAEVGAVGGWFLTGSHGDRFIHHDRGLDR
jgi:hypothetical protein